MIRNAKTKGKHFEFTKEKHPSYPNLKQIRATQDLHFRQVKAGDVGGWVACAENLEDEAWVGRDCIVYDTQTRLKDYAMVTEGSEILGRSLLTDNAAVSGRVVLRDCEVRGLASVRSGVSAQNSIFYGGSVVIGRGYLRISDSSISSSAMVKANGYIEKDSVIAGHAVITGLVEYSGAHITRPAHAMNIGPIGSEGCTAVLYRSADGYGELGHTLKIGCWTGRIDDLADEVADRRKAEWSDESEAAINLWTEQYDALEKLARVTVAGWK